MLIAVNDRGVPSVAKMKMVKVGQASWTAQSVRQDQDRFGATLPHDHSGADADHDHGAQLQTAGHDHAGRNHDAGELVVKHTHDE